MYNVNSNYSSNVQQKNNPSFGHLYMDEPLITKKLGFAVSYAAERVRPALEKIGEVVDVFVQPEVIEKGSTLNHLGVFVQDITPIAPKSKNPIKNCFNGIKEFVQIKLLKKTFEEPVFTSCGNIEAKLVEKAEKGKNLILQTNK